MKHSNNSNTWRTRFLGQFNDVFNYNYDTNNDTFLKSFVRNLGVIQEVDNCYWRIAFDIEFLSPELFYFVSYILSKNVKNNYEIVCTSIV